MLGKLIAGTVEVIRTVWKQGESPVQKRLRRFVLAQRHSAGAVAISRTASTVKATSLQEGHTGDSALVILQSDYLDPWTSTDLERMLWIRNH